MYVMSGKKERDQKMSWLNILILIIYITIIIVAGRGFCRWRNRLLSHLNPGDDPPDED